MVDHLTQKPRSSMNMFVNEAITPWEETAHTTIDSTVKCAWKSSQKIC